MRPVATLRTAALALLLTLAPLVGLHAQDGAAEGNMCRAPDAGATCDGSGPASQSASGGLDLGAGNPINVITGNKYQVEVDLPALPGELGLEIVRHYNSAARHVVGQLGTGWRLSYETDLYRVGQNVQILQADGRRLIFAVDPANLNQCVGSDPSQGWVEILKAGAGTGRSARGYIWHWTHGAQAGRQLHFDAQGKLVQIRAASGALLTLRRGTRGELLQVTDPQGRSLMVNHGGQQSAQRARSEGAAAVFTGIDSIDSPVGRFEYRHGSQDETQDAVTLRAQAANLTAVLLPGVDGQPITRHYHYENARHRQALTGISVRGTGSDGALIAERIATYAYDEQGKAVLSERGAQQVTLQYLAPALPTREGATLLTNSLGEQTLYRHRIIGGEYRLTEAVGAGCAQCGPVNRRWQYDEQGLLIGWQQLAAATVVDGDLQPVSEPRVLARHDIQRNTQGAIVQSDGGQARYDDPRWPDNPTRISRPSVVTGKLHRIDLAYNETGQLTELTERGYSPIDAQGDEKPTAIARTTRYHYTRINGRSVLTEVDGPLANGPKASPSDSDITRYAWDKTGSFVTEVQNPGGFATELTYDAAGRVVRQSFRDGYRQIDTHTEYAVLAPVALERERITRSAQLLRQGKPDAASRQEQTVLQAQYDALGRRVGLIDATGQQTQAEYDGANFIPAKLSWDDDSDEHDVALQNEGLPSLGTTESLLRASALAGRHSAEDSGVSIRRDSLSRPVAWEAESETLLRATWGEPGTIAQSHILTLASDNGQAQRRFDDFGRVVAARSPGVQWQTAYYDAADRIVRIADARGATQVAHHDVAGRLLRLQRDIPGESNSAEVTELQWHGALQHEIVVIDVDGERLNKFHYDALGNLQEEVQEIVISDLEPVRFIITHESNASGERIRLADATGEHSTLVNTRDTFGRIVEMRAASGASDWISGDSTLVTSIDWTRVHGIPYARSVVYGDGRTDSWPMGRQSTQQEPASATLQNLFHATDQRAFVRPGENHDSAGLPGSITTSVGPLELKWDAAGRLKELQQDDRGEHFIYDARGRRVAKRVGNAIRYFAWDGQQLAGEADARGRLQTRYVYLGWRPIAQLVRRTGWQQRAAAWFSGPDIHLFSTSHSGRVLAMYDHNGALLWQDTSRDLLLKTAGQPVMQRAHQPLRDVGQYADDESGLIYHVARFFDPQTGMFLSPDPQGVADTLSHTHADLLINSYAYAGGDPEQFFDPDGAAKITYYAITTGVTGRHFTPNHGFTVARWAFTIEGIQPGGDSNSDLGKLRNQYATEGTNLLYDKGGNFVPVFTSIDAIVTPDGNGLRWESNSTDDVLASFTGHYGNDLISITQFTIEDADDDNATRLLWYLSSTEADRKSCEKLAPGLLPEIKFGPGEDIIRVTQQQGERRYPARSQRIINCGVNDITTVPVQYTDDEERRRVELIEAAAEGNETSWLNKDCSRDGCPGIAIHGQDVAVYHASYGRSQFTVETFIRTLDEPSASDKLTIGITDDIQQRINDAENRAYALGRDPRSPNGGWFGRLRARTTCANAASYWDNAGQPGAMSAQDRNRFQRETLLGRQAYIDMVCFRPQGDARPLLEGVNAFIAESIFSDAVLETWLMDLYRSEDRFNFVSRTFIRDNLRLIRGQTNLANQFVNNESDPNSEAYASRQREIERNLAMRTARMHNSGRGSALSYTQDVERLLRSDPGHYVRDFLGDRGNWPSLRCGDPSTAAGAEGWRGLLMRTLELD